MRVYLRVLDVGGEVVDAARRTRLNTHSFITLSSRALSHLLEMVVDPSHENLFRRQLPQIIKRFAVTASERRIRVSLVF